jgi:hypothetical protein
MQTVLKNNSAQCSKVYGLDTTTTQNVLIFTDQDHSQICEFNVESSEVTIFISNGSGQEDGSKGQFVQPTGIFTELKTVLVTYPAVGKLKMVTSCDSLSQYLFHLNKFAVTFGIHQKGKPKLLLHLDEIIQNLEDICRFDVQCVNAVREQLRLSDTAILQGPQGTVSQVTLDDQQRLIKALKQLKDIFMKINPDYVQHFNIQAITILIVERVFAEERSALEMPLMSQFSHLFERTVRDRLKRHTSCSFNYWTGDYEYYQQITNAIKATLLTPMPKPAAHPLPTIRKQK